MILLPKNCNFYLFFYVGIFHNERLAFLYLLQEKRMELEKKSPHIFRQMCHNYMLHWNNLIHIAYLFLLKSIPMQNPVQYINNKLVQLFRDIFDVPESLLEVLCSPFVFLPPLTVARVVELIFTVCTIQYIQCVWNKKHTIKWDKYCTHYSDSTTVIVLWNLHSASTERNLDIQVTLTSCATAVLSLIAISKRGQSSVCHTTINALLLADPELFNHDFYTTSQILKE